MDTVHLKANLLEILDNVQDENLLQSLYDFLKSRESGLTANLWGKLTNEEKEEVLLTYDESEKDENLVPYKEVFK